MDTVTELDLIFMAEKIHIYSHSSLLLRINRSIGSVLHLILMRPLPVYAQREPAVPLYLLSYKTLNTESSKVVQLQNHKDFQQEDKL